MEEDLKKISNVEILNEMNHLDDEIWYKIIKYNKLLKEITTRYPQTKEHEDFKPIILCKEYGRR